MSRLPDTPEKKAAKQAEREALLNPRKSRIMSESQNQGAQNTENTPNSAAAQTNSSQDNLSAASGQNNDTPPAGENQTPPAGADNNAAGSYNPMQRPRVTRSYSKPVIDHSLSAEIPEVVTNMETPGQAQKPPSQPGQATANAAQSAGIANPENQLTDQEKLDAATQLTDAALDTYDKAHYFAREFVKIDKDDLKELHIKGEININERLFENPDDPNGEGETVEAYFTDVNNQIERQITVDPDFKQKVRPPMIRMFQKMGWGLSDGTYLLYMFGQDMAVKTGLIIAFKKAQNVMLEQVKEGHKRVQKDVENLVEERLSAEVERIEEEVRKKYESQLEQYKSKQTPENTSEGGKNNTTEEKK